MDVLSRCFQMLYPDVKIGTLWTLISSFVVDSMIPSAKALCLSCDSCGSSPGGWLFSIVEEMAGPIEMDTTFEDAGAASSANLCKLCG